MMTFYVTGNTLQKVRMLVKYYEGKAAKHRINIETFLGNAVGVGEHPDIVATIDKEIAKYASAIERIEALERIQREWDSERVEAGERYKREDS